MFRGTAQHLSIFRLLIPLSLFLLLTLLGAEQLEHFKNLSMNTVNELKEIIETSLHSSQTQCH